MNMNHNNDRMNTMLNAYCDLSRDNCNVFAAAMLLGDRRRRG